MSDVWSGREVLVTGASGFIGSHLVERLVADGARVRAFCRYHSGGSLGWLSTIPAATRDALAIRRGDIRDARFVESVCAGVDTVFHLAALIAIPYSYLAPQSYVETNVGGTLNVLEGVRRAGCRRLVHTSTSEVYGTPTTVPIIESHPLRSQSPYAASKTAADKLCEAYFHSYDVPVVTLRPFNTYGPRQSTRAVIPTILVQLLSDSRTLKLGRLDAQRDFTYITDTVDGLVKAAETDGVEGEVIQLGTGRSLSIGSLVETACRLLCRRVEIVEDPDRVRPAASEVMTLQSDPAKAQRLLRWAPTTELEDGLRLTSNWVASNRQLAKTGRAAC